MLVHFWHVKEMNRLLQVFYYLAVFSPQTGVAPEFVDKHEQALQQIRVYQFRLVLCCHIYWHQFWSVIAIKIQVTLIGGLLSALL